MDQCSTYSDSTEQKCFLCFSIFPKEIDIDNLQRKKFNGTVAFEMLVRYLNINILKEEEEPEVVFCPGCTPLMAEFWEWYKNLEAVRLCLNNCVQSLCKVMENGKQAQGNLEACGEQGIFKNLRKEMFTKCRAKLLSKPTVKISKVVVPLLSTDCITHSCTLATVDTNDEILVYNEENKTLNSQISPSQFNITAETIVIDVPVSRVSPQGGQFVPLKISTLSTSATDTIQDFSRFQNFTVCPSSFPTPTEEELYPPGGIYINPYKPLLSPIENDFDPYSNSSVTKGNFTNDHVLTQSMPLTETMLSENFQGELTGGMSRTIGCEFPCCKISEGFNPPSIFPNNPINSWNPILGPDFSNYFDEVPQVFSNPDFRGNHFSEFQSSLQQQHLSISQKPKNQKTAEKIIQCFYCNSKKTFCEKKALNFHLKSIHSLEYFGGHFPPTIDNDALQSCLDDFKQRLPDTKWSCTICQKTFTKWPSLKVHILQTHISQVVKKLTLPSEENTPENVEPNDVISQGQQ